MADKEQKSKTSAEQKKAYTVSTPDGTVVLSGICRVDRLTDYNEFYSILSRRAARVRCRHGVTIRQEVGPV